MIWFGRVAVAFAVLAALALVLSGPGTRFGLWPWNAGIILFGLAGLLGIVGGIIAAIGLLIPRARQGALPVLLAAIVVGAGAAVMPLLGLLQARSAPPINDVSTDLATDLQPLMLAGSAESAFSKALAAAEAMGWEIAKSDPKAGRIEAVATSFWFGFKDDVVVRVTPTGSGSRIDVRSKSRVGGSDAGTNARRIRAYFERLK